MSGIHIFQMSLGGTRSIQPTPEPLVLDNANIVFDGNSLTKGDGSTVGNDYPSQLMRLSPFATNGATMQNLGVGGQTTLNMLSDAVTQVDALFDSAKSNNILCVWEIRNHLVVNEPTNQYAYDKFVEYCQGRIAKGWYVVIATVLPSWDSMYRGDNTVTGYQLLDSDRKEINTWLRNNYKDFAHELADLASINGIGNLGDNEPSGYVFDPNNRPGLSANGNYVDGTHCSDTGYGVVAGIMSEAIQRLIAK